MIYVAGRPHVLRRLDKPLENVECVTFRIFRSRLAQSATRATGVTTEIVEAMENNFKKDVLFEVKQGNGRILLHDEVEERPGFYSIIPIWESVTEDDIMTPRDVFELVQKEGYRVSTHDHVSITHLKCFRLIMVVWLS